MPEFKLAAIATTFALAVRLLVQVNQGISIPKWLAPIGLTGLLALLMLLLPWMQKGSGLAFVVGYVAIAFLVINLAVLSTLAHLPGTMVKMTSASSSQAGAIVLGAVGTGLRVMFKSSAGFLGQRMVQMTAFVLSALYPKKQIIPKIVEG
jgi:hypothetical protein